MAKEKIHPLWYSEFIPILFFVSSIFAGLSMVIFEGSISQRVFSDQLNEKNHKAHDDIIHGLSKICAFTLMIYFFLHIVVFVHGKHWLYLGSRMGAWYLVEIIGFVIFPMILYFISYRTRNINLVKISSLVCMIGIIINRLNVTVIAFKWDAPTHYVPSWQEIVVTLTVLSIEIWIFRWLVRRLPVLRESPDWVPEDDH
jgi:Ni/Fe-hydrogenase subunit HybB-like protein